MEAAKRDLVAMVDEEDKCHYFSLPVEVGIPVAAIWNAKEAMKLKSILDALRLLDIAAVKYQNNDFIEFKEQIMSMVKGIENF